MDPEEESRKNVAENQSFPTASVQNHSFKDRTWSLLNETGRLQYQAE